MAVVITKEEAAQLALTIEMFEVITQSQPDDWQSLRILQEAYRKLDRKTELISASNRLAQAYARVDKPGRAAAEYKGVLKLSPTDFRAQKGLAEVEYEFGERAEKIEQIEVEEGEPISDEERARRKAELKAQMAAAEAWINECEKEEDEAWNGEAILRVPTGLRYLSWWSVKLLAWNLPFRGWLLQRWYSYQQDNQCIVRSELAVAVRQPADVRSMVFAFEMMLVMPRGRGPALRELLPLPAGEQREENDEGYGRLYRNHFTGTFGPDNLAWLNACTEFAREFRETMEREYRNTVF
jgi:hypothetical protein